MSLDVINNAPVKFIDGTYVGYNQLSLDCNCITRPFCQLLERDDQTAFEVGVSAVDNVELVTAGDFSTACGVDWTCGANWSIAAGQATKSAGGANPIDQPVQIMATRYYRITFNLVAKNDDTLTLSLGGNTVQTYAAGVTTGTKTEYILLNTITDLKISFSMLSAGTAVIDDVTLVEFSSLGYQLVDCDDLRIAYQQFDNTGVVYATTTVRALVDWDNAVDDGCYKICIHDSQGEFVVNGQFFEDAFWTLAAEWSIAGGVLSVANGTAAPSIASQTLLHPLLSQCCYTITLDVSNHVAGDVLVELGGINYGTVSADGSFSFLIDLTGQPDAALLELIGKGEAVSDTMDIDNVSIALSGDTTGETTIQCCPGVCSECFKLADEWDCTFLLSWTNSDNAFGFNYNPLVFTQFLRLEGKFRNPVWDIDKQTHLSSSGAQDMLYARVLEKKDFIVREIPDYLHAALAIGLSHDTFKVDGFENINNEDTYEPDHRKSSLLSPVTVELEATPQDLVNSNC